MEHEGSPESENMWEMILNGEKRNYIMITSTYGEGESESGQGIVAGHAYSLLSAHEVEYNGETVKLVKLRNPWGWVEWNGDWSDDWEGWTDELKEELNFTSADDGLFFINFEDFLTNFGYTSFMLPYAPETHFHNRVLSDFNEDCEYKFYSFTVPFGEDATINCNENNFAISCSQQGNRIFEHRDNCKPYEDRW